MWPVDHVHATVANQEVVGPNVGVHERRSACGGRPVGLAFGERREIAAEPGIDVRLRLAGGPAGEKLPESGEVVVRKRRKIGGSGSQRSCEIGQRRERKAELVLTPR
jgi:hypothetical protein